MTSLRACKQRLHIHAFIGLLIGCVGLVGAAQGTPGGPSGPAATDGSAPAGMVWVPAGDFTMRWDGPEGRPDERPAHRVNVDGFWIDEKEVTNAEFRAFVEATGYVTSAERPVDWEELKKQVPPGTPRPQEEDLMTYSIDHYFV